MKKNYIIISVAVVIIVAVVLAVIEFTTIFDSEPSESQTNSQAQGEILTFQIASYLEDCIGVSPQKCMVINNELFYDQIQGFEYQEGTEYTITVRQIPVAEPVPQDASAYTYELVEILEEN